MSLSPKDPVEKIVVTFDFTAIKTAVSNPVITICEKGTTTNIPSMLSGAPQITTNKILQLVVGGDAGKSYTIKCQVDNATTGERFVVSDVLSVKNL